MSNKKRKVSENGLQLPPKKKLKTCKYDRIKMIYNHDSNIQLKSYNEWNILFDNLKQYFNSDGIVYNVTANNIIKILTEFAVGNINECGKCQENVLILKNESHEHGDCYDFNDGDISEFICNNCDITCDICEQSTGYHICYGLISKHPKKYLCEDCATDCIQCGQCMCYAVICNFCKQSICDKCATNCNVCREIIM